MSSKKVTEFHEIIDNNQLLEYVRNQEFGSPTSIQAKAIPAGPAPTTTISNFVLFLSFFLLTIF